MSHDTWVQQAITRIGVDFRRRASGCTGLSEADFARPLGLPLP